ncbi:MAG TPA: acylphosphatase [Acidimicrobiales bacterium]|nr:acylphosphatase [Acidimicrobiales bacterium]
MSTDTPAPDAVRRRVVADGLVQGVGFRASCAHRAMEAGLAGWVRNLEDGRVEAVFEGPTAAVESLVAWCREGPPFARVTRMTLDNEPTVAEVGFTVR